MPAWFAVALVNCSVAGDVDDTTDELPSNVQPPTTGDGTDVVTAPPGDAATTTESVPSNATTDSAAPARRPNSVRADVRFVRNDGLLPHLIDTQLTETTVRGHEAVCGGSSDRFRCGR